MIKTKGNSKLHYPNDASDDGDQEKEPGDFIVPLRLRLVEVVNFVVVKHGYCQSTSV